MIEDDLKKFHRISCKIYCFWLAEIGLVIWLASSSMYCGFFFYDLHYRFSPQIDQLKLSYNMRPTLSYILLILFITVVVTTTAAPGPDATHHLVYDITGNKVLNNVPYYIGPVIWANGGGIKLTDKKDNKKVCPFYVVQDPAEVNLGGRFSFTQIAKQKYLLTSRILGIDSGLPTGSCDMSTFWQIADAEAKAPFNLITTGGTFDSDVTCFQIVDYPKPTSSKVHSYMLQHCPSFCGAGPQKCFNVSIYEDKGVKHLGSSGTPFEFVFQKAK
ncbi:hypothetical protein QVD17_36165 [Tagetes erecta]|uniref:Uncharacterized protein n=1 Tax=Tagetes erecta TaxID=13708 RepID=A0AAD8NIS1_TARER|nr:hypothetical protein QVD17_36165 [Tagetes erecta]